MTAQPDLRLIDDQTPPSPAPRVFTRSISAPPGLPWEQARAADLEARMGAPLPLDGVAYQVRRLGGWSFGEPARFAAFYVRADEIGDQLVTMVEVDGRPVEVRFASPRERGRRATRLMILAVAAGLMFLAIAGPALLALKERMGAADRLQSVEQAASVKLHGAERLRALKQQTLTLDAAGARSRSLSQAIDDLAMVSAAKAPGAHIQAFHWDRGYVALEVRGEVAPLVAIDRRVQKADKPLRPGVWLWAVAPASAVPGRDGQGSAP